VASTSYNGGNGHYVKQERKDVLESAKFTLQRHPVVGCLIIVSVGLVIIAASINQFHGAYKAIREMLTS
jgi:hypothetical protein